VTSTIKSAVTADISGLVDGTGADASDVLNPIEDVLEHVKSGRVAVTAADANVKHLNDAVVVGSGLTKAVQNAGADEALQLAIDSLVVATLTGSQTLSNKTLTTPVIGSFASANHTHQNAAGGGQLNASSVFSAGTVPVARLPVMSGDGGAGGVAGLVPAPAAGDAGKVLSGAGTWITVGGVGTVTSVGVSAPSDFAVSGSPVTGAGTISLTRTSQAAGRVLASPAGSAGVPSYRALAASDIPTLTNDKVSDRGMTEIVGLTETGTDVASIDLTSIPASYDSLMLMLFLRTTRSTGTSDGVILRFNNDSTAANYHAIASRIGHNASTGTTEVLPGAAAGMSFGAVVAQANSTAGYYAFLQMSIYNYRSTTRMKNVQMSGQLALNTTTGNIFTTAGSGIWNQTAAAINQITLIPSIGLNFAAGSSWALYGIG
jgi:hypothetical protein